MGIYKKFLIVSASFIVFFLSGIGAINYFIDPGNQFFRSHSFEAKIANILLTEKEVMVRANYNERALQKLMIEKLASRPEIFVLGSSHSMPISTDIYFKGKGGSQKF